MMENWNETVKDEDLVIHLGDVCMRADEAIESIFQKLRGEKILIRGNHDTRQTEWYTKKLGFTNVYPYLVIDDTLLCHYPLIKTKYTREKEAKKIDELISIYNEQNLKKVIHGHVHNRSTNLKNHYNVSVEVINYTPIDINELMETK